MGQETGLVSELCNCEHPMFHHDQGKYKCNNPRCWCMEYQSKRVAEAKRLWRAENPWIMPVIKVKAGPVVVEKPPGLEEFM